MKQTQDRWLKAPNGSDSNLSERQWVHVRTEPFKNWFGDWENSPATASKVVDDNGEPLVVYHGTSAEFTTFDESLIGSKTDYGWAGRGFYAHPDKGTADVYGKFTLSLFMNIKNPYDFNGKNFSKIIKDMGGAKKFSEWLLENGYDGSLLWAQKMALAPTQIKSATRNVGTFSSVDGNITL